MHRSRFYSDTHFLIFRCGTVNGYEVATQFYSIRKTMGRKSLYIMLTDNHTE